MSDRATAAELRLRPPEDVMRLERLGASFQTRLSFLRVLIRRLAAERARVTTTHWAMNAAGFGTAVLTVPLGGRPLSLFAVTRPLADEARTDRVIATAWDAAFVLYDGVPDAEERARLAREAPKQEGGRFTERDLILSRANKSVRLFESVVAALAAGRQPKAGDIKATGYLMRTTAVYGNGKFGIADRERIAGRSGLGGPFAAEMLAIWLIRGFSLMLAEHVGGAPLDRDLKRNLGIGNATGLGMAPFLVSHPELLHAWIAARETALARVRALPSIGEREAARIGTLIVRAQRHVAEWRADDAGQIARLEDLSRDLAILAEWARPVRLAGPYPVERLITASERLGLEAQELAVALALEPFGPIVDDLADTMAPPEFGRLDPAMAVDDLAGLIERHFDWALGVDFDDPQAAAQFWYVSENKQEPRLGARWEEPGAARESPLDIARQVQALHRALPGATDGLARFLMAHPEHRHAVRRVQLLAKAPYAEIRENLIGAQMRPIDMLRAKLAVFGAAKFDPKSDRWTRVTLAQGAPLFDELTPRGDDWWCAAGP